MRCTFVSSNYLSSVWSRSTPLQPNPFSLPAAPTPSLPPTRFLFFFHLFPSSLQLCGSPITAAIGSIPKSLPQAVSCMQEACSWLTWQPMFSQSQHASWGRLIAWLHWGLSKPGFTWLTLLLLTPGGLTLFFEHELPKKLSVCLESYIFVLLVRLLNYFRNTTNIVLSKEYIWFALCRNVYSLVLPRANAGYDFRCYNRVIQAYSAGIGGAGWLREGFDQIHPFVVRHHSVTCAFSMLSSALPFHVKEQLSSRLPLPSANQLPLAPQPIINEYICWRWLGVRDTVSESYPVRQCCIITQSLLKHQAEYRSTCGFSPTTP